jgi:hypothetical protein
MEKKSAFVVSSVFTRFGLSLTIDVSFEWTFSKITNSGEFAEDIFVEHPANVFIGKMIGRIACVPHEKQTFTSSDILCQVMSVNFCLSYFCQYTLQGYLYKRGTWFKTWKKRYFILRKDIQTLAYYPSNT